MSDHRDGETITPKIPSRNWLVTRWVRFVLAVTFLTRLPIPITGEISPEDLRTSMAWYPLVGVGLGAAGWGIFLALGHMLSPLLSAALTVILLEMFTGALHLDGFMDTCDGLGSGAPRERALEIMKDSRVGAMGVFGAIAVVLLKVAALAALSSTQAILPLVAGWAAARVIPVIDSRQFRYARPTGTGGLFAGQMPGWVVIIAIAFSLLIGWLTGGVVGIIFVSGILALVLLVQAGIARKLGGLTGDVYGLGIELAEILALIGGSMVVSWTFI